MNVSTLLRDAPLSNDLATLRGEDESIIRRLESLEREVARLRASLATLEDIERYRDTLLRRHGVVEQSSLSRSCQLAAREFVELGSGFHFLEYSEGEDAYRWTGPQSEARLTFWLDRTGPILVRIGIRAFGAGSAETPVLVEVDGESFTAAYDASLRALVVGPVPPRPHAGPTEVVIHSPVMFCPAQSGQGDSRLLGMAINRIELLPA
jgi:hypothetical protein